jgi:prevent-host-death family protein
MLVTAKDLRFNISMLFKVLSKGEDITITYRGKPKAKLISYDENNEEKDSTIFGMWSDKNLEVDDFVRDLRRGRSFDL